MQCNHTSRNQSGGDRVKPPPRHRVGRALAALLIGPTAAATLIGFAGHWWWVIDLFSHFRVQYAVMLLVTGLLACLMRAWRLAAVAAAALVVNAWLIAPL